jgi:CheY-like chemotaxis protein
MRALLREHLEGLGFTVLTAEDGAAGLEIMPEYMTGAVH